MTPSLLVPATPRLWIHQDTCPLLVLQLQTKPALPKTLMIGPTLSIPMLLFSLSTKALKTLTIMTPICPKVRRGFKVRRGLRVRRGQVIILT